MDLLTKITDALGITSICEGLFNKFFDSSLKRDIAKKNKYKGYPSDTTKFFDNLANKTGIPFVDHSKRDYTLSPLIKHFMLIFNKINTPLHHFLEFVNMKMFGGFSATTRLKAQKHLLDAYLEYESKYENITIIDSLLSQKHNYYLKKILARYKVDAVDKGHGFKDFIINNKNYFTEIEIFFTIEERTVVDSARDASNELESMVKASIRRQLMTGNFFYTLFDLVIFVISFHKILIPQILENFEVGIETFSRPVIFVNNLAIFILTKWYIYIPTLIFVYLIMKSRLMKIFVDYIKIKIPYMDYYIIGDEMLKFLKTYHNIMGNTTPRDAFIYAYERLDNHYLKHILYKNINQSSQDLVYTAKPLNEILGEIPYIPQEYIDILRQSYVVGKPQEGVEKVVDLLEPRIEKISKDLNKYIFIGTFVLSMLLTLLLTALIYKDAMSIVEISDQEFIDRLKN